MEIPVGQLVGGSYFLNDVHIIVVFFSDRLGIQNSNASNSPVVTRDASQSLSSFNIYIYMEGQIRSVS